MWRKGGEGQGYQLWVATTRRRLTGVPVCRAFEQGSPRSSPQAVRGGATLHLQRNFKPCSWALGLLRNAFTV